MKIKISVESIEAYYCYLKFLLLIKYAKQTVIYGNYQVETDKFNKHIPIVIQTNLNFISFNISSVVRISIILEKCQTIECFNFKQFNHDFKVKYI